MDAYVFDAVRTPRGKGSPKGALHQVKPIELLAALYQALEVRLELDTSAVDDVVLGCVHAVGDQGSNIAKISSLYAGWSESVGGGTVNRFCASGLDALRMAALSSHVDGSITVAGGVESLSRVPMFADRGCWFSDPEVSAKTGFVQMGLAADLLATKQKFSREELDQVAVSSHARALKADERGAPRSMVPVSLRDASLERDECVRKGVTLSSLSALPPAFVDPDPKAVKSNRPELLPIQHLHHRGNSPGLADGAALALVGPKSAQKTLGRAPIARIRSAATLSTDPVVMLEGNVACARLALKRAGVEADDVDVFEVNESFAAVPLHFQRALGIDGGRLNPTGGAISRGHPLGATGGILLASALDELERIDGTLGLVSICGGAGVTVSAVIERL